MAKVEEEKRQAQRHHENHKYSEKGEPFIIPPRNSGEQKNRPYAPKNQKICYCGILLTGSVPKLSDRLIGSLL